MILSWSLHLHFRRRRCCQSCIRWNLPGHGHHVALAQLRVCRILKVLLLFHKPIPLHCVPDLPQVRLDARDTLHLRQGRVLPPPDGLPEGDVLRAYDPGGTFLGLVEKAADGRLRVQRLFVAGAGTGPTGANA